MTSSRARRAFLTGLLLFTTAGPLCAKPAEIGAGYLETFQSASTSAVPGSPTGATFRVYHLEFRDAASAKAFPAGDTTVFNRSGRFVDLFAPPTDQALQTLVGADNLVWLDYNRTIAIPEPPRAHSVTPTRTGSESVVRGGAEGYTGKGVTLALIDSGFDVRHPDFVTTGADGKKRSRFRMLWDTTEMRSATGGQPAPIRYPGGQPIGVIYDQTFLDGYLNAPEDERPEITWDLNGHGTSCAGIAAGSGATIEGGPHAGVAVEADLIGIRLGDNAQNTYLITAMLAWLDQQAGARPLVVSNSWGGHRSGHDGSSLVERQIDERFPANRPGRLVLFAAGNEGDNALHSSAEFQGADKPALLKMPSVGEEDSVEVTVYFDSADSSLTSEPAADKVDFVHGVTRQTVWRFSPEAGQETLEIYSKDGKTGRYDAYISGQVAGEPATFDASVASFSSLVNNPGTAENVLTVGSYDFNPFFEQAGQQLTLGVGADFSPMTVGDISAYSSPGMTRLGRLKPDFAAPGQWWTAPAPLIDSEELVFDSSGLYNLFNGTSAATPYAAGVMALLLEKNPQLTLNQVRALLDRHLKEDSYTGRLPNSTWGRGKLTRSAVEAMLKEP